MRIQLAMLRQSIMSIRILQEKSCPQWEIETLWKPRVCSRNHSDYPFPIKGGDDTIMHCLKDVNKFAEPHGVTVRLDEQKQEYVFKKVRVPDNVSWRSDY